jgi:hypothetical protein
MSNRPRILSAVLALAVSVPALASAGRNTATNRRQPPTQALKNGRPVPSKASLKLGGRTTAIARPTSQSVEIPLEHIRDPGGMDEEGRSEEPKREVVAAALMGKTVVLLHDGTWSKGRGGYTKLHERTVGKVVSVSTNEWGTSDVHVKVGGKIRTVHAAAVDKAYVLRDAPAR